MAGPLSHLKVLDLSRVLAGPWSTQFLADMGAEVVKVERPDGGDDTRSWGPPYILPDMAAYFTCCNRGKKSIAIAVTMQPRDRTMTDAEIDALAAKIVAEVSKKTGGVLRG